MALDCSTPYCLGTPQKGRKKCQKCRCREWRQNNPIKDSFRHLRSNAKRRGIEFNLTLQEFIGFCAETGYITARGLEAHSMTIDRIDSYKGYEVGNMQVLTRAENSRQGRKGKRPEYRPKDVPF